MDQVRVRFAPSPTGNLHIGGARTALFNWLFARHHGGTFVLRIEDTDTERSREESAEQIKKSLAWLGIDWDEGPGKGGPYGPYYQSERQDLYRAAAQRLAEAGLAYPCYCTPEELAERREEARRQGRPPRYDGRCRHLSPAERERLEAEGRQPVLRLRVPEEGTTVVEDLIRGTVRFENAVLDDFIIVKSNGMPTYNFACVVDDHAMGLTHIIRAEEHLSNTPKQILLYQALGYPLPRFAHVPMILAPDRSKLSKRHGATSVEEFRDQGFLPEAIVNYLALLGWSPKGEEEMLPVERVVKEFSMDAVSKNAAIYDVKKLTWLNGLYLRELTPERLYREAKPFLQAAGLLPDEVGPEEAAYAMQVLVAVQERVRTLAEAVDAVSYFYRDDFDYDEKGVRKHFTGPEVADILARGRDALAQVEPFDVEHTEAAYRKLMEELNIPGKAIIHPTRLALSGRTVGPGLFDIIALLGKKRSLERLDRAIAYIKGMTYRV